MNKSLLLLLAACAFAQAGQLRVGAAKIDVTPAPADMPPPYKTVLDHIYARAIVIDNGAATAALVTVDTANMGDSVIRDARERIQRESGVRPEFVEISATHSHSAPRAQRPGDLNPSQKDSPQDPVSAAYCDRTIANIAEVVKQAKAALQPARLGYGTGQAYINVNRDYFSPADNRWYLYQPYQGVNTQGVSDKTVAVMKFETLDRQPIAFYINYAVHGVFNNGGIGGTEVSGDLPGATSRYVEKEFGNKAVALWTSGAAGDQHPIYKVWVDRVSGPTPEEIAKAHPMLITMGQMLGEEVLFTASHIERMASDATISAGQKIITCPGQVVTPRNHPLFCAYPGYPVTDPKLPACTNYKTAEGPSGDIRLSLLTINKVAFAGISGEPTTPIGQHVKQTSPYTATIVVALTNGTSSYLPDDASYDKFTYESTTSKFARGCVEKGIVSGFAELMGD
jgi:hypothetical protein